MSHYAYIVRCADSTLYSGYSTDPIAREKAHNSAKGAKYTRSRLPVKLVYFERFDDKSSALKREAALKRLSHAEKEALIAAHGNGLTTELMHILLCTWRQNNGNI